MHFTEVGAPTSESDLERSDALEKIRMDKRTEDKTFVNVFYTVQILKEKEPLALLSANIL